HSGYNTVNDHGIANVTQEPDWARAFAQKQATLIAGTGYQYGDTDFIEYSERLYLEFSRQLRTGSGPVSVGKALVAAKQAYLAGTPQMRGIHEKALLEATLFGLPMLKVDMPGARLTSGSEPSDVTSTNTFAANPGLTLGLRFADVNVTSPLTPNTVTLKDPTDPTNPLKTVTATYLSGNDGVLANPAEPVLPLELRNVTVANMVLRGVGFRGGAYSDQFNVLPLTGAPTTELRGIHAPAFYDVFYPIRPWNTNYFDALVAGGATRLAVTPAQFLTDPDSLTGAGTLRKFSSMDFRLYYSNNTQAYSGNVPALSEPLSITAISADVSGTMMNFSARVTGEPAAGVQEVWVTYTALEGPFAGTWQSLNLTRNATDSTLWQGALNISGTLPEDVRFMVQAANGVGLVTVMTNLGQYYSINLAPTEPTVLVLETPASTSGAYRTSASFSAVLTNNGTPLEGQRVIFSLGGQRRRAITNAAGRATVTMLLNGLPGNYDLRVYFLGTAFYQPSFAGPLTFTITKQSTTLTLTPPSATSHLGNGVLTVATLTDAADSPNHLAEETVFFVITGESGSQSVAVITDYAGRAVLSDVSLPFGSYTVNAYFSGSIIPGTLVLDDARYEPSTATGSLALINNVPSVGDDAYSVDENGSLSVAAPGVLTNDDDADDDTLTAILVDAPAHGTVTLNADGSFTYTPASGFSGTDTFTYKANDGFVDSNIAAVTITVNSVDNLIYGAQNEDDSVQFFTVDRNTHEVNTLGPLQTGYDIEGIDLHPTTGALYATSENGGRLYTVDKETGLLTLVGPTGFNGVPGLSFKPDGTLWGWAKGKGLISINLSTGQGTLMFASTTLTKNVEGIAWNNDGALLYMVANRDLLVYNPASNTVTKIAGNLPYKTEAADMRPDGLLALGVHGYTIFAYDVNLKQIVTGENITTPYDDVEGLAWPN
ncbi:MAG: Ig-like domain-containing protein, partial [Chloroflexota bacterium]